MVIHFHFHSRPTGVTRSIENFMPFLVRLTESTTFGYGINLPRIGLMKLLKEIYSEKKTVIHTHRNNEIIFALLLRALGGRFCLIFTRHADTKPSGFTVFLMKRADHVVSLNKAMSEYLPVRNTMVRHGVNTEQYNIRDKKNIEGISQKYLAMVVGRIRRSKGQMTVLKAMIPVLRDNPEWALVLIGRADEDDYAFEIKAAAHENGIISQVYFVPETNNIADFYNSSTVVVISSLSEGFGLVCLEAMACGLITIATESVGINSDVIIHGKNGFLFPAEDHVALSAIFSGIVEGKPVPDPLIIRKTITDDWSVEKQAANLMQLYKNVCNY